MARKRRRKFTREFKLEAVRKITVDDRTYTDVGKEVDGIREERDIFKKAITVFSRHQR
jgi:transposase-like protein